MRSRFNLALISLAGTLTIQVTSPAPTAWAAACCSGAGGLPTLITTDDRGQFSATLSSGALIGDALSPGELAVFRSPSDSTQTTSLGLGFARAWSPEVQWGAQVSVRRLVADRDGPTGPRASETLTALGDLQLSLAWEFLPELSFSRWRPRGFLWGGIILPTGRSPHELSPGTGNPDLSTGTGFFTPTVGLLLLKSGSSLDGSFAFEASVPFTRTFEGGDGTVSPGASFRAQAGLGWSLSGLPLRLGARLAPKLRLAGSRGLLSQLLWDSTLEAGGEIREGWAWQTAYTDQTLMGPAWNATLGRTLTLSLITRWE